MSPGANPVLSVVTRSERVESWHRGAIAIVHGGELALAWGDVERPVFARSAVKPLQALPFLELGLAEKLALSPREIAVMCASHDGTPLHTEAVRTLLARGQLTAADLGCGPHAPFDPGARRALLAAGEPPTRLHNNCSGKHAGFLHLTRQLGADLAGYLEPESPAQRLIHAAVAAMAGVAAPVETGLDGCGAPTFLLPLAALARAFCRLANPVGLPSVRAAACSTILAAAGQEPVGLAGERRLCTALLRQWPGRAFAKNGAEGVYCVGLAPDPARTRWPEALGIAVKIDAGSERGYWPVVVEVLRRLGAFGPTAADVPESLTRFWRVTLQNTQNRPVGEVRSVFEWPA